MNREDIIRMAREVGLPHWYETEGIVNEALLIKFAALVASAKLEEVAKEFDKMTALGDTSASFARFVRNMKS